MAHRRDGQNRVCGSDAHGFDVVSGFLGGGSARSHGHLGNSRRAGSRMQRHARQLRIAGIEARGAHVDLAGA